MRKVLSKPRESDKTRALALSRSLRDLLHERNGSTERFDESQPAILGLLTRPMVSTLESNSKDLSFDALARPSYKRGRGKYVFEESFTILPLAY
jgi:hypothetical protein